jgi:hypothetical protein
LSKINLPDVTLLAISSIEIPATIEALKISSKKINFGAIKLLTHEYPKDVPKNILLEYCPKINDIMDFNHYVFKNLGKHVTTSHVLMVQYHAYIIHPELWDNDWLQYDYIGAPWPIREGSYIANTGERIRVGNGGFSLRSKKLLDAPKNLGLELKQEQGYWNEDGNLTCYHRAELLSYGIKYAPVEVAAVFSYENPVPENANIQKTFGFHKFRKDQ